MNLTSLFFNFSWRFILVLRGPDQIKTGLCLTDTTPF